jgi:hypothetical protein
MFNTVSDTLPPNLEIPNLLASNIENFMLLLASMEKCIDEAEDKKSADKASKKSSSSSNDDNDMERRINIAKLDDRFYDDLGDDEEEDVVELDRRGRFKQAYQVALATDTQGYCVSEGSDTVDRTPQELAAISWASFCTNILPGEDAAARIQALDCDSLLERLKLASLILREKKNNLKAEMKKNDIKFKGEEFDEDF